MFETSQTRKLIAGLLAIGTLLAAPLASALAVGVDADGVSDMKAAGATPPYAQMWAGAWTPSSWGTFEADLRAMRDAGVTPVIMWYYWGDGISPNAVKYGKDGKTKAKWDALADDIARRAAGVMGDREFLIVMEPEFNKNGISSWETFDGYLADQAWSMRYHAPKAKIVTGFGHWGGWDIFDRAMTASHYSGFQYLRGSTRDSASSAENSADTLLRITKELKARWGKGVFMYDFAVATYGGWEGVQERALQGVINKADALEAAGMVGLIWRDVKDDGHSSGYYGAAESSWGVQFSWGGKKRAYDELTTLVKGGAGSSGPSGSSTTDATAFRNVKGNDWWIQADVSGSPTWVAARVNGGGWITMPKQSWGAHAVSTHAPQGSTVELIATYSDGSEKRASYRWTDATPLTSASGGDLDATFRNVGGNDWWVQTDVEASETVTAVHVRVNGGSWVALEKKSWGAWAVSTHAPSGARLELRATGASGAQDTDDVAWR